MITSIVNFNYIGDSRIAPMKDYTHVGLNPIELHRITWKNPTWVQSSMGVILRGCNPTWVQ